MNDRMALDVILPRSGKPRQRGLFALISLGVVDSLAAGILTPTNAIRLFFHANNCLFVRTHLRDKIADEIMGRGLQLVDLFDALPPEKAIREFRQELDCMRSLCFKLLEGKRSVA